MNSSSLRSLNIGTRTSRLALWQTNHITQCLQEAWPGLVCNQKPFVTKGDKTLDKPLPQIGGKGLFTAELERALREEEIDIAVHSLKDLPIEDAPGLTLGAITSRADVRDGLVARNGWTVDTLPQGAVVGTSSVRRQAQLLARRPDLKIRPIRGNVDTRIRKVKAGEYDAAVLAAAGLQRLGLTEMVTEWLEMDLMLPAPGQGALAVQCRAEDEETLALLAAIDDLDVKTAVTAERAFLNGLGGGCSAPVAAYATVDGNEIHLEGLVAWPDGRQIIRTSGSGDDAWMLGVKLAEQAVGHGAGEIIATLNVETHHKPLQGKRIVVTRAQSQASDFSRKLVELGAVPVEIPMIRFVPMPDPESIDQAIFSMEYYDWVIFTSVNGVEFFWQRMTAVDCDQSLFDNVQVAAVGPVTANALIERGVQPDFTPDEFVGESVAQGMGNLNGMRILLPRADIGRKNLPELLTSLGAIVDELPVYRTLPAEVDGDGWAELERGVDAITFTSGSTVRNWVASIGEKTKSIPMACIGPVTAEVARDHGLEPAIVAAEYTTGGLIQALIEFFK